MTTEPAPASDPRALLQRYQALLDASDVIHGSRDLEELFKKLAAVIRRVVAFDAIAIGLVEPDGKNVRLALLETWQEQPAKVGLIVPLSEVPAGWVVAHQKPARVVIDPNDPQYAVHHFNMSRAGLGVSFHLPLTTPHARLGELVFSFREVVEVPDSEMQFMQRIADQIALAIENAMNLDQALHAQRELQRRNEQRGQLLKLTNDIVSHLELQDVLRATVSVVRRIVPCQLCAIALPDGDGKSLRICALEFPEGKGLVREGLMMPIDGSNVGKAFKTREAFVLDMPRPENYSPEMYATVTGEGLRAQCFVPLVSRGRSLGVMGMSRTQEGEFTADEVEFLKHVAGQITIAVENALAYNEIAQLKDRLAQEKLYLEDEIRSEINFDEIIGESTTLKAALQRVQTVATSDSTVLILGETGTGKELIARAIHEASRRKGRTFVKLNCAAIPTGLLESELFGHERGAFTGAIAQKIGRMELAHGGTLFLDEVGDIPLELQPKLLRALQEREFERLGSVRTQKADVRFLAATNRNLQQLVAEKQFRSDLFYRLNVFPIPIPALRERREDIPRLVRYFVSKYAKKMDKRIETIPSTAMAALQAWSWPGNVRELENFIERSVILTSGPVLHVPLAELESSDPRVMTTAPAPTLRDNEREHILKVLRDTRGVLAGPAGAAARLGVKRTTLQYKMKRLGITRDSY